MRLILAIVALGAMGSSQSLGQQGDHGADYSVAHLSRSGPRPILVTDDSSNAATCAWNCRDASAGFALKHDIKIFGRDDREDPAATSFSDVETKKYSGIGRLECMTKRGTVSWGTAFLVGSYWTMATAAHSLFERDERTRLNWSSCKIVFYDDQGMARETTQIASIASRWNDSRDVHDESNDIAIIRLKSQPATVQDVSSYQTNAELSGPIIVSMVGFHRYSTNSRLLRKVKGYLMRPSAENTHTKEAAHFRTPLVRPKFLAAADYDSGMGTSGAPVYNEEGIIVGLNQGSSDETISSFDPAKSYNLAILFDSRFKADLNAAIAEPPRL